MRAGDREPARQRFALLDEVFEADGEDLSEGYPYRLLSDPRFHAWAGEDPPRPSPAATVRRAVMIEL